MMMQTEKRYLAIHHVSKTRNMRALSHKVTFAGNLDATNCSACYRIILVAHAYFFKHILIPKNNM